MHEFGSVSWNLSIEYDIGNWKQIAEAVGMTAAIVALIWVVANDVTIVGVLDDALVAPLVAYIAAKAPEIYQWLSQLAPQLVTVANNLKACEGMV